MTISTLSQPGAGRGDERPGDVPPLPSTPRAARRANFFRAWTSSFLVYFFPRITGRVWLTISPLRALAVALLNFLIAPLWLLLVAASWEAFNQSALFHPDDVTYVPHPFHVFLSLFEAIPGQIATFWSQPSPISAIEHLFIIIGTAATLVTAFTMLFFVLLPFAAKPGRGKPCVFHTLRAVLMSTGCVHVWGPVLAAMYILLIVSRCPPWLENYILPFSIVMIALTLWTLGSLIAAAEQDYRREGDFPTPHDPWCEECGYNLLATATEGRCPECGTAVARSVGMDVRLPTPWEERPGIWNGRAIRHQLGQLFRHPRQLFFSMPTLTGQEAAHRWLLGSATLVAALGSLILPAGVLLRVFPIDWGWALCFGSLSLGIVWAVLALMMVGIETAGIATFSRLKARARPDASGPRGVYLAAAAKVTAYSSSLMLPWVILGGAQLIAYEYLFAQMDPSGRHILLGHHLSMRMLQVILASSLSVAHIGGLLWYELTVYRGVSAIQYANK